MSRDPILSIVLGTRNREDAFRRLVNSVIKHTTIPWEIVASQASDRPYRSADFPDNVHLIEEWPPQGASKGYNRAFRRARGAWVVWLNDDAIVTSGWDTSAIRFMEEYPQVGIGALYYTNNHIVKDDGGVFATNEWLGLPYANFGVLERRFGDQLGWFDEDLRFYGNDNSLCFKCYLAGRIVQPVPGTGIIHQYFQDPQRVLNVANQRHDQEVLLRRYEHLIGSMKETWSKNPRPRIPMRLA